MGLHWVPVGLSRATAGLPTHTSRCLVPSIARTVELVSTHERQLAHKSASSSKASPPDVRVRAAAAGLELPRLEQPAPVLQRATSWSKPSELPRPHLAYEIFQGALVRWSEVRSERPPPTAVLVHGILGSRKNMLSFARRIVEGFPSWQVLLVDLRCHGESACLTTPTGGHTVEAAANDILRLLYQLKLFPEVLIGHSFGGKVVMSMADQFGRKTSRLHRPVQVWVLDALPGEARAGAEGHKDHPADLIARLRALPLPIDSRTSLQRYLLEHGFSMDVAQWVCTNLQPVDRDNRGFTWRFDIEGIQEMYRSYEEANLWPFLYQPALGIGINFVKAENSTFKWAGDDEERIRSAGHEVHLLPNAGHWVHKDNPDGLFRILSKAFGTPDIHMQRAEDLNHWSMA